MRRPVVHAVFAVLSGGLALMLGLLWHALHQATTIRRSIASVPSPLTLEQGSEDSSRNAIGSDGDATAPLDDSVPEVRLARANAYAAGGELDTAERLFTRLIAEHGNERVGRAAQYNLANAWLREAMRADIDAVRSRPLAELAKQRYRDLLRATPSDWNARYNLERALQLAPEQGPADDRIDPVKRVNVIVPDFQARDLP